jgi:aldehyde dehydrogenase (NAD+)
MRMIEGVRKGEGGLVVCRSQRNAHSPTKGCKVDNDDAVACYRYFAGLADKIHGTTIELDDREKHATTRKEPIGVVAQIGEWFW